MYNMSKFNKGKTKNLNGVIHCLKITTDTSVISNTSYDITILP